MLSSSKVIVQYIQQSSFNKCLLYYLNIQSIFTNTDLYPKLPSPLQPKFPINLLGETFVSFVGFCFAEPLNTLNQKLYILVRGKRIEWSVKFHLIKPFFMVLRKPADYFLNDCRTVVYLLPSLQYGCIMLPFFKMIIIF